MGFCPREGREGKDDGFTEYEKKLVSAFIAKWNNEHPVYEDTSGSMKYLDIIEFIKEFAKQNSYDAD